MKRTKRYGGFLVGDRVQRKDGLFKNLNPGIIIAMRLGRLTVQWVDLNHKTFKSCFMPNQLINLTRQEEEELNKPIVAQIDENDELCVAFKEEIETKDIEDKDPPTEEMLEWIWENYRPLYEHLKRLTHLTKNEFRGRVKMVYYWLKKHKGIVDEYLKEHGFSVNKISPYPNPSPYPNCYTCTLAFEI